LAFGIFALSLQSKAVLRHCRWCCKTREESPGSKEYPASENESYWQQ